MGNEGNALESIIPFDNPKHPRLPANRFPKVGKAGIVVTAGRVAWITGKYLYKYHRKALFASVGLSAGLFVSRPNENGAKVPLRKIPNKFNQTYSGRRGRFKRRSKFHKRYCHCRPKRRFNNVRSRRY